MHGPGSHSVGDPRQIDTHSRASTPTIFAAPSSCAEPSPARSSRTLLLRRLGSRARRTIKQGLRGRVKTVILAGGLGTRLAEETDLKPKPMVEIGGTPILWHIMKIYAAHGFNEFVVASATRARSSRNTSSTSTRCSNDFTVDLATARSTFTTRTRATGRCTSSTPGSTRRPAAGSSGSRSWLGDEHVHDHLRRRRRRRRHRARCVDFHRSARQAGHGHGRAAAGALRRPRVSTATGSREFTRSRRSARAGSTAASSCSSRACSTTSTATTRILEREPLERLAADGQLMAYRHEGFWQPMDTLRDVSSSSSGRAARRRGRSGSERREWIWRATDARHRRAPAWSARGCRGACVEHGADVVVPGPRLGPAERAGPQRRRSPTVRVGRAATSRTQRLLERAHRRVTRSTPSSTSPRRRSSASPSRNPLSTFEANIRGTYNLLEACRRTPTWCKRVVVASQRQGLRRPAEPSLRRGHAAHGAPSLRRQQVCADLIAQSLRAHLRRCRSRSRAAATSTAAAT